MAEYVCKHCYAKNYIDQRTSGADCFKCTACGFTNYFASFESEQIKRRLEEGNRAKAELQAARQENQKWQEHLLHSLSSFELLKNALSSEDRQLQQLLAALNDLRTVQADNTAQLAEMLASAAADHADAQSKLLALQQTAQNILSAQDAASSLHAHSIQRLKSIEAAAAALLNNQQNAAARISTLQQAVQSADSRISAFQNKWEQSQLQELNNTYKQAQGLHEDRRYDEAEALYREVIQKGGEDPEVYWRMFLCHYGVEYQYSKSEDGHVPTILRPDLDSCYIRSLLLACSMPDAQRAEYAQKLIEIERILDKYRQIYNQTRYDVFISVKQKDEDEHYTIDSDSASDLYDFLTSKGLHVFNSRRCTHELPAGKDYEPYIIAALQSAKVLIVVGSCPEYMNAQWVRNEWSRFQWLQRSEQSHWGKTGRLLFCYLTGGMSAYAIPKDLNRSRQAITDSVTAHDALLSTLSPVFSQLQRTPAPVVTPVTATPMSTAPLIRRAFLFLEDGDWQSADEYCERVLDQDPENAEAYLGKLMAELHVHRQQDLKNCDIPFDQNNNYVKAIRFGSPALKSTLQGYISHINTRIENSKFEKLYEEASDVMLHAEDSPEEYKRAAALFEKISHYKDSANQAQNCADAAEHILHNREMDRLAKAYLNACALMEKATTESDYRTAARMFEGVIPNGDAAEKRDTCLEKAETLRKDAAYSAGLSAMKSDTISGYTMAISHFKSIPGWRDADELISVCQPRLEILQTEEKEQASARRKSAKEKLRRKKRSIAISFTALITCAIYFVYTIVIPNISRNKNLTDQVQPADLPSFTLTAPVKALGNRRYATSAQGFSGKVYVELTLDKQGAISSITIGDDDFCETTGFGSKAKEEAFWGQYIGQSGPRLALDTDIDAISAATITSNAVNNAVNNILSYANSVRISADSEHTIGLKTDGFLMTVNSNSHGQSDFSKWQDIVAVASEYTHTIGLKADGSVVAEGNNYYGRCDVSSWQDIVSIASEYYHTIGLKADGSVIAVGDNTDGKCDVSSWQNIVAVAAGYHHTVGLKADGSVIAVGYNGYGQCNVSDWRDIVAVAAGNDYTVGLKADGTVIAVGNNSSLQCSVSDWQDIVAVATGYNHTIGLKADGSVIAAGNTNYGKCNVTAWRDIVAIAAGQSHTVGLKADGTVVAVGSNSHGQCNVSDWDLF